MPALVVAVHTPPTDHFEAVAHQPGAHQELDERIGKGVATSSGFPAGAGDQLRHQRAVGGGGEMVVLHEQLEHGVPSRKRGGACSPDITVESFKAESRVSSGWLARPTAAVARERLWCFERRLPRGYSRFGDARPGRHQIGSGGSPGLRRSHDLEEN